VLKRLSDRRIPQNSVIQAILSPDEKSTHQDVTQYQKRIGKQKFGAVVRENNQGQDVILSAWVDPPNPGTTEYRRKKRFYEAKKASLAKKLWLTFLNQIGL
jgi:hypothetical protein